MGLHTYSKPGTPLVVFSVSDEHADYFRTFMLNNPGLGIDLDRYTGMYNGVLDERVYIVPQCVYDLIVLVCPIAVSDQESVLLLDEPGARGWRKAKLMYLDGRTDRYEDLGVFLEAHPLQTMLDVYSKGSSYTYDRAFDRYFVCAKNPPTSEAVRKERELQDKLAAYSNKENQA